MTRDSRPRDEMIERFQLLQPVSNCSHMIILFDFPFFTHFFLPFLYFFCPPWIHYHIVSHDPSRGVADVANVCHRHCSNLPIKSFKKYTHTYVYIYIYIYIVDNRRRKRENKTKQWIKRNDKCYIDSGYFYGRMQICSRTRKTVRDSPMSSSVSSSRCCSSIWRRLSTARPRSSTSTTRSSSSRFSTWRCPTNRRTSTSFWPTAGTRSNTKWKQVSHFYPLFISSI